MLRFCLACAIAIPFAVSAGCSQTDSASTPPVVKVAGKVLLDGQPMAGGEVRFTTPGQSVKVSAIRDGNFAGEAYVGKNQVGVVWDKDGKPNTMNPGTFLKVNAVADTYSGPKSTLSSDVGPAGATDLKFEVKSARK